MRRFFERPDRRPSADCPSAKHPIDLFDHFSIARARRGRPLIFGKCEKCATSNRGIGVSRYAMAAPAPRLPRAAKIAQAFPVTLLLVAASPGGQWRAGRSIVISPGPIDGERRGNSALARDPRRGGAVPISHNIGYGECREQIGSTPGASALMSSHGAPADLIATRGSKDLEAYHGCRTT
jgi:hypothetical protein